jgi:Secretion system C-terminal sorting domain
MKRSFTSLIAIAILLAGSSKTFGQACLGPGGTIANPAVSYDFSVDQGFGGDFSQQNTGSGQMVSTDFTSTVHTKVLTTATLFLPNTATSLGWSFNLGGTANVTGYTVEAIYSTGSGLATVTVCNGTTALTTTNANLVFAASPLPPQIVGNSFKLRITFTSTSTNKYLVVDNFVSDAGAAPAPLPVTISYFSASGATGGIKLTWLVASELNVNRYEVERSANGKTFTKIGQVSASGLSTYTYLDAAYQTGSNYYRLKAVDNDGKYKYSVVVLFKVGKNTLLSTLKVYPVPTGNELTLQHDAATDASSISVVTIDGKVIKTVKPTAGDTETKMNVSSLKPGLYLIRYVVADGESVTTKLVKQ